MKMWPRLLPGWLAWSVLCLGAPTALAGAQTLPAGPIETANGTVTVGGAVSATFGGRDNIAFFNFTDYEHNALRMFRVSLTGQWRPTPKLALLTEIRSENGERVVPYAMYARVRPWTRYNFDIQAGRIPPVFGAFARRTYSADNPLIGYPLAYQYLTSLRPDAIPATADDLLFMRARGWLASYPVGVTPAAPGVPIASGYRWNTGVEAHAATKHFDAAMAVTTGTLSSPPVDDQSRGAQVSGRAAWTPVIGLVLGASASHGAFLDRSLSDRYATASGRNSFPQNAAGVDAEYSRGYWILRGEAIVSRWTLPSIAAPFISGPLTASSGYVETRYRLTPRFFVAGRADRLTFSTITGQRLYRAQPTPWDAPVTRLEAGGGVYIERNLTVRTVVQRDWRDAGLVTRRTYLSTQVAYWF